MSAQLFTLFQSFLEFGLLDYIWNLWTLGGDNSHRPATEGREGPMLNLLGLIRFAPIK